MRGQSMSSLLESLFDYIECGAPLCLQPTTGDPGGHDSHFVPENSPSNAAVISFLTGVLNEVPGNMPLATPFLGRVLADEEDPGPTRLLRAMTLGRGRFNLGVDASFARFNRINGTSTSGFSTVFVHGPPEPGESSETDVISASSTIALDMMRVNFGLGLGLTDFLDFGLTVPAVTTTLNASSEAAIVTIDPGRPHRFGGTPSIPVLGASKEVRGTATGMGDVAARMRLSIGGGAHGVPAAGDPPRVTGALLAEVSLPTGAADDLLGAGEARARVIAAFTARSKVMSWHANLGYLARAENPERDQALAGVGADYRPQRGLSISGGLQGGWEFRGSGPAAPPPAIIPAGVNTEVSPIEINDPFRGYLNASLGFKARIGGMLDVVSDFLAPLPESFGFRPSTVFTLGIQSAFR